jgi:sulfate adenylyltransferase subunit 1
MNAPESLPPRAGLLRLLACGSVDDGKSTLIGRLLYDTRAILADTLAAIEHSSRRRGLAAADLSLLTDGLQAEREQGITIDVAYRYFSTGTRKYILADAPGHEQYTRNMVTAASTADLAVVLVDARKGVLAQTRRHAAIVQLLGIRQVVVAVNKMDLVDFDAAVFARIRADFIALAGQLGLPAPAFVPLSALDGDMVVERGARLGWHDGPTLLELLAAAEGGGAAEAAVAPLRFPVQYVCRPRRADDPELHDYRGLMGRIESGSVAPGDRVAVLPAGRTATVLAVEFAGRPLARAVAGQSVTLRLAEEIDVARGDMIAAVEAAPQTPQRLAARLCWLAEAPFDPRRRYLLRHTTREVRARLTGIERRLDIASMSHGPAETLAMNDIADVRFELAQPLCADRHGERRATGAFIVIDAATGGTVGAGMIS